MARAEPVGVGAGAVTSVVRLVVVTSVTSVVPAVEAVLGPGPVQAVLGAVEAVLVLGPRDLEAGVRAEGGRVVALPAGAAALSLLAALVSMLVAVSVVSVLVPPVPPAGLLLGLHLVVGAGHREVARPGLRHLNTGGGYCGGM